MSQVLYNRVASRASHRTCALRQSSFGLRGGAFRWQLQLLMLQNRLRVLKRLMACNGARYATGMNLWNQIHIKRYCSFSLELFLLDGKKLLLGLVDRNIGLELQLFYF